VEPVLEAAEHERAVADELQTTAVRAFQAVPSRLADALDDGLPLRREVLARWSELVGGNRLMALMESATGMVRAWVRDALSTVSGAEEERIQRRVQAAVADTVADLTVEAAELAVGEITTGWRRVPAGGVLLDRHPELAKPATDLEQRAERLVAEWQHDIVELIRTKGAELKVRARWLTTALNAGATAAILLTFASTAGLTGAEVGIAAGAGAANQALLARLLGQQNLNWLLREVRHRLLDRVGELADGEARRYTAAVEALAPRTADMAQVRRALGAVQQARR
jgi:hypothetical protein